MPLPQSPNFNEILEARQHLKSYLQPTLLQEYPSLGRFMGCDIWVKHENHLPTAAFKVRGGINLMSQMESTEKSRGVIAASTGNHGQSVAYAAKIFGVKATICVPQAANPAKVESMKDLGAEIIAEGRDFDEAREHCERLAKERGYRYIHSGNEPLLIAGVATATLEILEELPCVDVLLVPVGGGSGAAGACLAAQGLRSKVEVIGVQSEAAPAAYRSWKEHRLVEDCMGTWAEGLATRSAFELPQQILWELMRDFVLVSEGELRQATRWMIEKTRNLVEGAGAAALAAAVKLQDRLAGRRVVLICSGGNLSMAQLKEILG
ncbi:MAG: threonine/serine dehydratase [Terriglobia bacterium]